MKENPYSYGPPVSGETGFYDRDDIFRFVNETLAAPRQNVITLYGQRRIGKTSILLQIPRHLQNPDDYQVVFYDLQGETRASRAAEMLYDLAKEIADSLKLPRPDRTLFVQTPEVFESDFLPQVYECLGRRRLLLTIDEFDMLAEKRATPGKGEHPFVRHLDRITQDEQHQERVAFIFVIGRTVKDVTSLQRVFRIAASRQVAFLPRRDAIHLITEPAQPVLTYTGDAVERILALTGCHPYYIQLLCNHVFREVTREERGRVTPADVNAVLDEALDSAVNALSWFWDDVSAVERFILFTISRLADLSVGASLDQILTARNESGIPIAEAELRHTPNRLVERQILVRDQDGYYRFAVELVRRWIARTHSVEEIAQARVFGNPQAQALLLAGKEAEDEDDLTVAIANYRRATISAPNYVDAYLYLGRVLLKHGDIEGAIGEFVSAHRFGGAEAREELLDARLLYGHQLEEKDQASDAIREYERILELDGDHLAARQRLARLHLERAQDLLSTTGPDRAASDYASALGYQPESQAIVKSQLQTYKDKREEEQEWHKAERAMEVAVELLDADAELHRGLIDTRLKQSQVRLSAHDIEAAQKTSQRALDGCLSNFRTELVKAIKKQFNDYRAERERDTDWERAEAAMKALVDLLPDASEAHRALAETRVEQANFGLNKNRIETAQQIYQRAMTGRLEGQDLQGVIEKIKGQFAQYRQGQEKVGNWKRAEAAMQSLVRLLPDDLKVHLALAETRVQQAQFWLNDNKVETAQQVYQRALDGQLDVQDRQGLIGKVKEQFAQYRQGQEKVGDWKRAETAIRVLVDLLPNDQEVPKWLADTLIKQGGAHQVDGKMAKAKVAYQAAVQVKKDLQEPQAYVLLKLAGVDLETHDIEAARESCQGALTELPSPEVIDKVKALFIQYRQDREGENEWERAEKAMHALVALLPDKPAPRRALAETYRKQVQFYLNHDDIKNARATCQRTLENLPDDQGLIKSLKEQFDQYREKTDDWELVAQAMEALTDLLPEDLGVRIRLANTLVRQGKAYQDEGKTTEAQAIRARADKIKAEIRETLLKQIQDLLDSDEIKKVQQHCQQVFNNLSGLPDLEKSFTEHVKQQFDIYRRQQEQSGMWTLAQESAQALSGLLPDKGDTEARRWLADTCIKHANFYLSDNNVDKAIESCSLALDCTPDVQKATRRIKNLFQQYRHRKEESASWKWVEQAMQSLSDILPNDPDVLHWLADIREKQGDVHLAEGHFHKAQRAYGRAIEAWQALHQAFPDGTATQESLARTWVKQGRAYLSTLDVSSARDVCRQALAELPGALGVIEDVKYLFNQCREDQESIGRWVEAEQVALALVVLLPQSFSAHRQLVDLCVRQGDIYSEDERFQDAASSYIRALDSYERLIEETSSSDLTIHSEIVAVWEKLGDAYQQLGQPDQANHAYTQAIKKLEALG